MGYFVLLQKCMQVIQSQNSDPLFSFFSVQSLYPMACVSACHQIVPSAKKERKEKTSTNNETQKHNIQVYFTVKIMRWQ